ncbi:hypothetical protein AGLY_012195, partial [Aphis glycines]
MTSFGAKKIVTEGFMPTFKVQGQNEREVRSRYTNFPDVKPGLNHLKQLRAENYIHLKDAVGKNDFNATDLGQMVVLPSSFTGGPRYMHERTQDAMTYVRVHGRPDLFITFTCNPTWKDIIDALFSGQKLHVRHYIRARTKGKLFGDVRCYMYSVEWQKRGLPHVHILLWLQNRISSNIIDNVISAEIPDPEQDPLLYDIVK